MVAVDIDEVEIVLYEWSTSGGMCMVTVLLVLCNVKLSVVQNLEYFILKFIHNEILDRKIALFKKNKEESKNVVCSKIKWKERFYIPYTKVCRIVCHRILEKTR